MRCFNLTSMVENQSKYPVILCKCWHLSWTWYIDWHIWS